MIASRPYDRDELKARFESASPFPFFVIDDFLDADFASEVAAAYPSFEQARDIGREFSAVNEKRKVQITDSADFAPPVARLHELLASSAFLSDLEYITGIPALLSDPLLRGGGMHISGSQGRLDVHVDFNYQPEDELHRRLNILVYLNPEWHEEWGGALELWDPELRRAHHTLVPTFNRCVLFQTSETSYHGVTPIACPPDRARISFAGYYYTKEAPPGWDGRHHSTIFKARPGEVMSRNIAMPAERTKRAILSGLRRGKRKMKSLFGR